MTTEPRWIVGPGTSEPEPPMRDRHSEEYRYVEATLNRFVQFIGVLVGDLRSDLARWSAVETLGQLPHEAFIESVRGKLTELVELCGADSVPKNLGIVRKRRDEEIRARAKNGERVEKLRIEYGLSMQAVYLILGARKLRGGDDGGRS